MPGSGGPAPPVALQCLRPAGHLRRVAVGDTDRAGRWAEATLGMPLELEQATPALLTPEADRPWFRFPGVSFAYLAVPLDDTSLLRPLILDGRATGLGLALAGVYR